MLRLRFKGFTLIEILIVLILLGLLAAIMLPQFSNAGQTDGSSAIKNSLRTIRDQIKLYKLQHGDSLPDLVQGWDCLTQVSRFEDQNYGPYFEKIPVNPLNGGSKVSDSSQDLTGITSPKTLTGAIASPGAGVGYLYDYQGGKGSGLIFATGDLEGSSIAGTNGTAY